MCLLSGIFGHVHVVFVLRACCIIKGTNHAGKDVGTATINAPLLINACNKMSELHT